jgi:tetratricopeptide (TPR) repeat protein
LRRERQGLHARIAGMLEVEFARDKRRMPEILAQHCREGALHAKAAEYWQLATEWSIAKGDLAGAIVNAKEALAALALLPDTAERETLRIDRALALGGLLQTYVGVGARQTQDAWAHAHALCQASGRPDLRARGMHGLFYTLWTRSDFTRAEAVASDMLVDATKQDEPNASMVAHRAVALAAFATGDFAKAIPHYEAAYGCWRSAVQTPGARPAAMDLAGVLTMSGLCYSRLITGRPAAARNLLNEAVQLARTTENPHNVTVALATACFVGQIRRKPASILALAEELDSLAKVSGGKHWTRIAPLFLRWARCAKRSGGADDLETMRRQLETYCEAGTPLHAPLYLSLLADSYRWSGSVLEGLGTIESACALAEQTGEQWNLPDLWRLRGDLCLLQARPDREEALDCYERGMALARDQGSRLWLLRCAARRRKLRALSPNWRAPGSAEETAEV